MKHSTRTDVDGDIHRDGLTEAQERQEELCEQEAYAECERLWMAKASDAWSAPTYGSARNLDNAVLSSSARAMSVASELLCHLPMAYWMELTPLCDCVCVSVLLQ